VQMMIDKNCGDLDGLRFLDENGIPLLTCGRMVEDPNCLATPNCLIKEFNLQEDQRIVGFKSYSGEFKSAFHGDFQFVLMAPMTKTVLLKLLANKTKVSTTDRGLGKLPEGVFREVIRFVRY
jgi:hypothetical protein